MLVFSSHSLLPIATTSSPASLLMAGLVGWSAPVSAGNCSLHAREYGVHTYFSLLRTLRPRLRSISPRIAVLLFLWPQERRPCLASRAGPRRTRLPRAAPAMSSSNVSLAPTPYGTEAPCCSVHAGADPADGRRTALPASIRCLYCTSLAAVASWHRWAFDTAGKPSSLLAFHCASCKPASAASAPACGREEKKTALFFFFFLPFFLSAYLPCPAHWHVCLPRRRSWPCELHPPHRTRPRTQPTLRLNGRRCPAWAGTSREHAGKANEPSAAGDEEEYGDRSPSQPDTHTHTTHRQRERARGRDTENTQPPTQPASAGRVSCEHTQPIDTSDPPPACLPACLPASNWAHMPGRCS